VFVNVLIVIDLDDIDPLMIIRTQLLKPSG